ncbi:phytoene desaturase family protein [Rhodococcus qingshengii]|uniref:phytoene desaturase family protein n=1 Tax=Rhodococcus qingshengii TaxID=334542 RepID=UPI001ADF8835|nr:NAD(P)/FAD-dependent oxidoreductase [Rhodococcus qingshengii]MCQ4148858.1 NAD(P)/FAD-dependent oxidoreductase [Rhodococcus qingshengii]
MTTAVVVGSGPNGLAAAIELARAGIDVHVIEGADKIGGGTRSSEYIVDGLVHDDCSAFHPTALASPYFKELDREFGLAKHGLTWLWPEIDLVHPLDDGTAGVLWRDINRTAEGLGVDGKRWLDVFGYLAENFDELVQDVFKPIVHLPKHPLMLARFGTGALLPATGFARMFKTPQARALFGGVAAHMFGTLTLPLSSAVGSMLTAGAHAHGWPVAHGGSGSIAAALASILRSLGGTIETGNWVTNYSQIADYDIVMLDIAPDAAGRLLDGRQPDRIARAYRKFRYGTAAYKVDYAVRGDSDGSVVPWTNPHARKAGTLHLSGTISETAAVERQTVRGQMPAKPFILLGQQFLADPSRSVGDIHPVWAYAHVPHGYPGDATDAITSQIERFAPGFRERIVGVHVRNVPQMQAYNPNYVGGDISAGANTARQIIARPRFGLDPYATGAPGVYLCSSATPPGGGVHGMGGFNAARAALKSRG